MSGQLLWFQMFYFSWLICRVLVLGSGLVNWFIISVFIVILVLLLVKLGSLVHPISWPYRVLTTTMPFPLLLFPIDFALKSTVISHSGSLRKCKRGRSDRQFFCYLLLIALLFLICESHSCSNLFFPLRLNKM